MATTLDYFAILGVSEGVSQAELEARYQELADYLASPAIPAHLREWAGRQASLVDEAYAVLADPERRAATRQEQQPATEDVRSGSGAAGAEAPRRQAERPPEPEAGAQQESPEEAERRPEAGRASGRAAGRLGKQPVLGPDRLLGLRSQPLLLGVLIGLMVLGAILLGRYGLPGGGAEEVPTATELEDTMVPLDEERVAELMVAVQQNPNDPGPLFELGEVFFTAGEWQPAIDWFTRLLAVDPDNIHALTDVGTANFNLGRNEEAKLAWLAVLAFAPNDVQAHYNLGFLYANVEPLDLASARREWQIVVDLAPDSDLARTAQVHLEGLTEETEAEGETLPP